MLRTDERIPDPVDEDGVRLDLAIRVARLSKHFGDLVAVDDLSFHVPTGSITAFVGPNGAGKTTTIRMLLGLMEPTSGGAQVLGHDVGEPTTYLQKVGAMIEGPAFYPTLSGRRNLEVLAALGRIPIGRVDDALESVRLRTRAGDLVGGYSSGMKQRLGIAAALLPSPALLVLDEPTNGLDPRGILEMRELLRSMADRGTTVFVSSHLLSELERVADWLILIKDGKALFDGPLEVALAAPSAELVVGVDGDDPELLAKVARIAADAGHDARYDGGLLRLSAPASFARDLNRRAFEAGVTLTELHSERATLETTFLEMMRASEVAHVERDPQ